MKWKIPLFKIYWEEDDIDAVSRVIKRGNYWATGPEIEQLEKSISNFFSKKYAISFNSGTSALHAVLLAHNIRNVEVIVPSFTFVSTANAVVLAGSKPIFAEIEDQSYGLDSDDVKEKITNKTKAIIPVHYGGAPCKEIKALKEIADDYKLLLIEDAAESFGAKINNKLVGTFGLSAMFSFCQNKVLTTGEGGAIVTDDEKIYQKAKLIRSHGRVERSEDYFASTEDNDYIAAGYNFRMPTMVAALGISQLNKIENIVDMRRKQAKYLSECLSKIEGIIVPKELEGHFSVYQMYTIQLKNEKTRNELQEYLSQNGIMSKIYFNPVHLKTVFRKKFAGNQEVPKTEKLSKMLLTLPFYADMSKTDLDLIVSTIYAFFQERTEVKNERNL